MLMPCQEALTSLKNYPGGGQACPKTNEHNPDLLPGEAYLHWKNSHRGRSGDGRISMKNSHSLHPTRHQTHLHRHLPRHQDLPNSNPPPFQEHYPQTSPQCSPLRTTQHLPTIGQIILLAWHETGLQRVCQIMPYMSKKAETIRPCPPRTNHQGPRTILPCWNRCNGPSTNHLLWEEIHSPSH